MSNVYPISALLSTKKTSNSKKNDVKPQVMNITEEKISEKAYEGGRHLNAIWLNPNLNTNQCVVLQCIASFMNFTEAFENQWRYVSISTFMERTKLGKETILRLVNGYEKRNQKGLIELGYIRKRLATKEKQLKGEANDFCLTEKIFLEFLQKNPVQKERRIIPVPSKTPSPTETGGESPTETGGESPTETQNPKDQNPKDQNVCVQRPTPKQPTHTHFKNEEKERGGTGKIPIPICIPLANWIQLKKSAKNYDNPEAGRIISNIIKSTGCTLDDYVQAWSKFDSLDSKPTQFHLRKFNEETVSQAFISWMTVKDSPQKLPDTPKKIDVPAALSLEDLANLCGVKL